MEKQLLDIISNSLTDSSYLGDDCAVVNIAGEDYLFCLDNFIENTHFSSEYFQAADIGWKALAVNISDIAAMSGQPLYALVGLSLNKEMIDKEVWVKQFYEGMQACADKFGSVKIIGGDISSQEGFTSISVALVGKAQKALLRKLSQKQDYKVCVTGKFGNSKSFLMNPKTDNESDRSYHLRPEPRLDEAQGLNDGALMDASDGLAAALFTLAQENKAHIKIDSSLIPKDAHISLNQALYGGEDYELVGLFKNCPEDFIEIGSLSFGSDKQGVVFDEALSKELEVDKEFQHF